MDWSGTLGTPVRPLESGVPKVMDLPYFDGYRDPKKLDVISKIAENASRDPQLATVAVNIIRQAGVAPRDYVGQLRALLRWVQNPKNVYYINEIDERLQDPFYTLKVGYGDCDDLAILLYALARSARFPVRLVISGMTKGGRKVRHHQGERRFDPTVEWNHIYLQIGDRPYGEPVWYYAEPTLSVPLGWDVVAHSGDVLPEMSSSYGASMPNYAAPPGSAGPAAGPASYEASSSGKRTAYAPGSTFSPSTASYPTAPPALPGASLGPRTSFSPGVSPYSVAPAAAAAVASVASSAAAAVAASAGASPAASSAAAAAASAAAASGAPPAIVAAAAASAAAAAGASPATASAIGSALSSPRTSVGASLAAASAAASAASAASVDHAIVPPPDGLSPDAPGSRMGGEVNAEANAVAILVVDRKGQVLLLHRAPGQEFMGGAWDLPGGKVRKGSAREQAAQILYAETGIRLSASALSPLVTAYHPTAGTSIFYVAQVPSARYVKVNAPEHGAFRWVTPEAGQADMMLVPYMPLVLESLTKMRRGDYGAPDVGPKAGFGLGALALAVLAGVVIAKSMRE